MKKYLLLLSVLLGSISSYAQDITGTVVDPAHQPIEGATVLLHTSDSVFVDAVISKSDGTFSFSTPAPLSSFLVIVQHLAYHPRQLVGDKPHLGMIQLEPQAFELNEIVVQREKPYLRAENGKLVYDTKTIANHYVVDTAWDLVSKLPSVSASGSSVSLFGANKTTVLINGKPSTMSEEQLYTILSNMPAQKIKEIEVMYNAPPQYHANGAVINLMVQKSSEYSLEGEVSARYANQFYSDGGLNATMRMNTPKASLDVMYGVNRFKKRDKDELTSWHTFQGDLYDIQQSVKTDGEGWEHHVRTAFDYQFNPKSDFNLTYTGRFRPNNKSLSHSVGNFQQSINTMDSDDQMHNVSLSTRLKFGLSLGADYTHYTTKYTQDLAIDYATGHQGGIRALCEQNIDRYTIYADQHHSLPKEWSLGYGLAYTHAYDRDSQIHEEVEGDLPVLDTDAQLREHEANAYVSLGKQFKTGLSINASLKGEYYKIGDYKKWSLYPQFSLSYQQSPKHSYQLGLSTRKIYPPYWGMQSSISYIDGYSEVHGSPGLRPTTNYNLNAAYIFKQKYILSGFYYHSKDYSAQSPYQSPDRLVLIYKYQNWDVMSAIGLNAIVPIQVGQWLHSKVTLAGMFTYQRCDEFFDISFNRKKLVFRGNMDNTFTVAKNLSFELNGFLQTPSTQGTFDIKTLSAVNVGMKWLLAHDKLALSVHGNDIFNTMTFKLRVDREGQHLQMDTGYYSRSVNVKLTYRFGGFKSKRVKQVDTSRFGH